MKPIRTTALGAAALALSMPLGFSLQSEAPAASGEAGEAEACACTCAACVAMHGAKAEAAPKPVPNLPELSEDIDAEVARILAMDLEGVDVFSVPEEVTFVGATSSGIAEVFDATDSPSEATSDERGYMGISLGANEEGGGAMVGTVNDGSPAEKAGLKAGDLIVAAEGMPLESNEDLIAAVIDLKVGQTATLEIERGDEELELDIVLGPRAVLPSPMAVLAAPLAEMGYASDDEDDEDVVLPDGSPVLLRLTDAEEGNSFVFESSEAPELRRRIVLLESGVEGVEHAEEDVREKDVQLRWSMDPGEKRHGLHVQRDAEPGGQLGGQSDALPDGYIEVYTRRVRRPGDGDNDELRRRMHELEREIAELSRVVAKLRAELDRRNPR